MLVQIAGRWTVSQTPEPVLAVSVLRRSQAEMALDSVKAGGVVID